MKLFHNNQTAFPMPRSAFVLLITSVVLSIFPHIQRVPPWLLLIFFLVILWRIQIFRQRAHFPSRWLRLITVFLAMFSVLYQHGTIFGPEAGVGLLISAYCLKLLEMYTQRDAYLIIILSYFVLATVFLFDFSLYASLYLFFVFALITSSLVALNQTEMRISIYTPLQTAIKLLLQALPLTIALFYLFPRIGPVWDFAVNNNTKRTGLSDQMSPGDISNLSQSEELAFRVKFEGRVPTPSERYWRAVVFDRYDGATWYAVKDQFGSGSSYPSTVEVADKSPDKLNYQVILEPTNQHWLLSIPFARISNIKSISTPELMNLTVDPIDTTTTYQVTSSLNYKLDPDTLHSDVGTRYTQLPAGNPRSRQLARQQFLAANKDPNQFVSQIMQRFNTENYYYTLTPPKLTDDRIDQFLLDTKKGFCSHYASALVFLMRSVGIPARLVGGYQGGEMHPYADYLLVHQYDAHAWAEYWVQGEGWIRIDPTVAIAPNRIEMGARSTVADWNLVESPLAANHLRNNKWLAQARLLIDYADYLWIKNVVSYDKESQSKILEKLLGSVTPAKIALLMFAVISLCLMFLILIIIIGKDKRAAVNKTDHYLTLLIRKMEKLGVEVIRPEETAQSYCVRAAEKCPKFVKELKNISYLYNKIKYSRLADVDSTDSQLSGLKQESIIKREKERLEKEFKRAVQTISTT